MTLEGKAVLVTGGSRGIGRALAIELRRRGATVGVHFARRNDAATEVVRAVESGSPASGAFAVRAELGEPDGPERLIQAVRGRADSPRR